tara:strand:- start:109 stop:765 length:657 start_codon:yes stop_codon:yes gene_type:complete
MKKTLKVAYLLDKNNFWIEKYIKKSNLLKKGKFVSKVFTDHKKIRNYEIVFILNYTKILNQTFLKKNKLNIVVHASNLPKGKGFSPMQWQILKNKNKIPICLFKATSKVDSGEIYEKNYIFLRGTELYDELRYKQAIATFKIIKKFLNKYPRIKGKKQKGKSTFYKRRTPQDSRLNINLSLKKLFNHLRLANNTSWPSYFIFKNKKYYLTIYQENKKK